MANLFRLTDKITRIGVGVNSHQSVMFFFNKDTKHLLGYIIMITSRVGPHTEKKVFNTKAGGLTPVEQRQVKYIVAGETQRYESKPKAFTKMLLKMCDDLLSGQMYELVLAFHESRLLKEDLLPGRKFKAQIDTFKNSGYKIENGRLSRPY